MLALLIHKKAKLYLTRVNLSCGILYVLVLIGIRILLLWCPKTIYGKEVM
jgi:hypothetical protein